MKKLYVLTVVLLLAACTNATFNQREYGDDWPFTANTVTVGCDAMGYPYVDAGRQGTYGLTGHAVANGYPPVEHIHIAGKSLTPFIQAARDAC